MMPNLNLTLVAFVCCLFVSCFQANKPLDSTQTGNPPVIDTARVALYLTSGDLRVIGEPGAVEPGGAKVEVTNLTTGKTFTTEAAEDGSFNVKVAGSENDAYSVRAKTGSRSSTPVFVIRGNAAVGDGEDGSLSCEQRNMLAGELLTQASSAADRSCKVDGDCEPFVARANCYAPGCWFAYVSARGRGEIERVSREIDANLCAQYEADGCSHPLPKCATPPAAVCSNGQCSSVAAREQGDPGSCDALALKAKERLDDAIATVDRSCNGIEDCVVPAPSLSCRGECPEYTPYSLAALDSLQAIARDIEGQECAAFNGMGCGVTEPICPDENVVVACIDHVCTRLEGQNNCVTCLAERLEWQSLADPAVSDISSVAPCAEYERHRFERATAAQTTCKTKLVACNAITSTGAISTALAHPAVMQVLTATENPVRLGDNREGAMFRITIGKRQIELGGPCEGAPSGCVPVPQGVARLRETLQQIDSALSSPMASCAGFDD